MTRLCSCSGSVDYTLGLNSKRNQVTEASCRTCGGRYLVDGIEPVPESMLESAGLEVMNSINPELNWKSITKGRRTKKSAARSLNGVVKVGNRSPKKVGNRSPKRVGNFCGSDSDKFGEAGLGQMSCGKVEHIPIKKRRHLLRSLSPTPRAPSMRSQDSSSPHTRTSSSSSEDLEQLSDQNHSSGHGSLNSYSNQPSRDFDRSVTVKVGKGLDLETFPEGAEGVKYSSGDFSGIALLAAAACINSMEDDDGSANKEDPTIEDSSVPECSVASTCRAELKVGFTHSESGNALGKERVHAHSPCTIVPDGVCAAQTMFESVKAEVVQASVSSKMDRLHWDLNTVMDAWDEPYDASEVANTLKDTNDDGIPRGELDGECCGAPKFCEMESTGVIEFPPLKRQVNNAEEFSDSHRTCIEKTCSLNTERCFLEPVNPSSDTGTCLEATKTDADNSNSAQVVSDGSNSKTSIQPGDKDAVPDVLALSELPCSSSSELKEKINGTTFGSVGIMQGENCCSSMIELEKTTSSEIIQARIQNLTSHEIPALELSVNDTEDSRKNTELPNATISLKETRSSVTCTTRPEIYNSGSNSTEVDLSHLSSNCRNFSASVNGDQFVAVTEGKDRDDRVSDAGAVISDLRDPLKPEEMITKHEGDYRFPEGQMSSVMQELCKGDSGRGQNVDPSAVDAKIGVLDDCHDSDVSQDNHGCMTKFQTGYDSPYEDGELRVSVLNLWEDNEVDGENECVDYDSDGRNGDGSDAVDNPGSDIIEGSSEGSLSAKKKILLAKTDLGEGVSVKRYLRGRVIDDDPQKEMRGKIESNAGSGTSVEQSISVEENDDSGRSRRVVDLTDAVDGKGLYMDDFGSRGKLQSRIEGPSPLVANGEKDSFMQQYRSRRVGGPYPRSERDVSPEKYAVRYRPASHARERDGGDNQWTYWESRNHYPSRYHGPNGQSHTRPRTAINDSTNKFGGLDSHDHRQNADYFSSRGSYRPSMRRSPIDRDDCYGIHRRMPLARGTGNNRIASNSGPYSRRVERDIRDDYHEPVSDNAARVPYYLSRRESSFSPNPGRGSHISLTHRKSCSRSRSPSPPRPWHPYRERNFGTRRHSRSPDFRADTRTERIRMPYPKPNFASDYGDNHMSPPRGGCFSPQRNCRWVGDRNFMDNRVRHRRSPVRMFRRNERFDTVGSSGQIKPDDSFRTAIRPARFSFMANGDRRSKFEDGYEERIHRARLSDNDGSIRRFTHDSANNFEASSDANNADDVRGTDRRDVPRGGRGR